MRLAEPFPHSTGRDTPLNLPSSRPARTGAQSGLTQLRVLGLADNRITDEGLAHLEELTKLEQLDLEDNPEITDEGLEHLDGLIRLKVVDFLGTNVTKVGVSKLQKALPNTQIVLD